MAAGAACGVEVVRAVDVDDAVAAVEVIAVRGGATDSVRLAAPRRGEALVRPLPESHCAPGVIQVSVVAHDRRGSALVVGAPVAVTVADNNAGSSADLGDSGGAVTVAVVIGAVVVAVGVGVAIAFAAANGAPPDKVPLTLEVRP